MSLVSMGFMGCVLGELGNLEENKTIILRTALPEQVVAAG